MKLKTNKSTKKRITAVTKRGILMRSKMSAQHLCPGKSKRTKQNRMKNTPIEKNDLKRIKKLIPYL